MYYVYDGSFEGFLSATTELLRSDDLVLNGTNHHSGVCCESQCMPLLPSVTVSSIDGILDRFSTYISRHFGASMLDCIYRAFLSELSGIENSIVDYICLARKLHHDPIDMLHIDCVKAVAEAAKRTGRETHRFIGLLRFRKLIPVINTVLLASDNLNGLQTVDDNEIYYAEFKPDTDCLPLLAEHFINRFDDHPFIIADRKRNRCLLHYSRASWTITDANPDFFNALETDTIYEELWRMYFKCLAIPNRINPKLQAANMPKKHWKYLVEKPGF